MEYAGFIYSVRNWGIESPRLPLLAKQAQTHLGQISWLTLAGHLLTTGLIIGFQGSVGGERAVDCSLGENGVAPIGQAVRG